jgi:hypothetical protein
MLSIKRKVLRGGQGHHGGQQEEDAEVFHSAVGPEIR